MKIAWGVLVGVSLAFFASAASADDDGRVPAATLRALGLADMQAVSDAEGMQVRGMSSSASASGVSFAFVFVTDGVIVFAPPPDVQVDAQAFANPGLNVLSSAAAAQVAFRFGVVVPNFAIAVAAGSSSASGQ